MIKKIFIPAMSNIRLFFINPRIYIVFLLIIMYFDMVIAPIRDFCNANDVKVGIWVWQFIMSDYYGILMIMLGLIMLLCDAPFINKMQPYLVIRTGRKNWVISQFIYIFLVSFIYLVATILISILLLLPNLSLSLSWGKVINTFANQPNTLYDSNIFISFPYRIVAEYTPITSMLTSFFFAFLVMSFLGSIMFVFNLITQKSMGTIIAIALVLLEILALNSPFYLTYFSPVSWCSIAILDTTGLTLYPSTTYACVMLISMIIISLLSSIILFKKKTISKV